MTRITILLLGLLASTGAMGQIAFNGRPAMRDSVKRALLVSVPEAVFGNPYTACISLPDKDTSATLLNRSYTNGDSVSFPVIDADARYPVTIADTTYTLQFTFLPIVEINGFIEKTYNTVTANVWDPDSNHVTGPAKVKFRGSSINSDYVKKRAYHIKFVNDNGKKRDVELLGLRDDNSWILDGGTFDFIRIRNRVLTDLWLDMAAKPYYADEEPKARSGVRGGPVEVFRNGEYQGFYMLTEALDRKQMKLEKLDEDDLVPHGLLYKSARRTVETKMLQATEYDNTLETWGGFEIKYPDIKDLCPTDYSVLWDAVNFVANSPDSVFADSIKYVLDMPVIVDYYIFLETAFAYDNMGKNMYWGCYDRDVSRMLTPAVWDLDATLGQHHSTSVFHPAYLDPATSMLAFSSNVDNYLRRLLDVNPDGFREQAVERYWQLRQTHLDHDRIMARFDAYLDVLARSGATAREQQRYNRHSDLTGRELNLSRERDFIDAWLAARFDYLDSTLFARRVEGDITGDRNVDVADINLLIDIIIGKKESLPEADLKHDGRIDVADLNRLVTIILNTQ